MVQPAIPVKKDRGKNHQYEPRKRIPNIEQRRIDQPGQAEINGEMRGHAKQQAAGKGKQPVPHQPPEKRESAPEKNKGDPRHTDVDGKEKGIFRQKEPEAKKKGENPQAESNQAI